MKSMQPTPSFNRRASLQRMGTGMGMLGLAGILAQDKSLGADATDSTDIKRVAGVLDPKPTHFALVKTHHSSVYEWWAVSGGYV